MRPRLVVQVKVGSTNIRVFNAYGPQEKLNFWQSLEKEIVVGPDVISDDPNNQSENGRLLIEMLARQNLHLVNASESCPQG